MLETHETETIANRVEALRRLGLEVDRVIVPTFICKLMACELTQSTRLQVEGLIKCDFQVSELEDDVKYVVR